MSLGPSVAFDEALVQIIGQDDRVFGAGVVIDDRHVLTCAHVIAAAAGLDYDAPEIAPETPHIAVRRVYVSGRDSDPMPVRVVKYSSRGEVGAFADIAVLELAGASFTTASGLERPLPAFDDRGPEYGDQIHARGFPGSRTEARTKTAEAEYIVGGHTEEGWLNTRSEHGHGAPIQPGFSGGPVWNHRTRAVAGIITEADAGERVAVVIPIDLLRQSGFIPQLPARERAAADTDSAALIVHRALVRPGLLRLALDAAAPRLHLWLTTVAGLFDDPPERRQIVAQMQKLAADFERGLSERTYLPPPTRAVDPKPGEFRPIRQLIRRVGNISGGGDGASAYISALSHTSRRVKQLVHELRNARTPLILLGEPGAGKSMTLQQAAIAIARREELRVFPHFCLFVPLGRWKPLPPPGVPDSETVQALVQSACAPQVLPYLTALQDAFRLTVIFDGMDEMSRERYVEHTAALNAYASAKARWVRTLFSCRIADFSPNFEHRRMVLFPFDQRHMRHYLARQLGAEGIEVDGKILSPKELAAELARDDMPIQAQNPYVLYLLCLYIRDNRRLPKKRVDLLAYNYELGFARAKETASSDAYIHVTLHDAFGFWGAIALEITRRNNGNEIRRTDVQHLLGPDAEDAITVGKRTGALVESRAKSPGGASTLRFENHRAQEYFCAIAIHRDRAPFDWSGKLDAPRWQETLVNLVQMGGADEAVDALIDSIAEGAELLRQREFELGSDVGRDESRDIAARLTAVTREADAAERIDLAARVARDMPLSNERDRLEESVRTGVATFLKSEDPNSRAMMLRLIQRSPELGSLAVIQSALADRSVWVREQAYVVASRLSWRASASSIMTELAIAYTNWTLLGRLPRYLKVAAKMRSPRAAFIMVLGALLLMLQATIFTAMVPAMAVAFAPQLRDRAVAEGLAPATINTTHPRSVPSDSDTRPPAIEQSRHSSLFGLAPYAPGGQYWPILLLLISSATMIFALIDTSIKYWHVPIAGIIATALPLILLNLWNNKKPEFGELFGIICSSYILFLLASSILAIIGILFWALANAILHLGLWLSVPEKGSRTPIWRPSFEFAEFGSALGNVGPIIAIGILFVVGEGLFIFLLRRGLVGLIGFLAARIPWLHLPWIGSGWNILLTCLLYVGVIVVAVDLLLLGMRRKLGEFRRHVEFVAPIALGVAIVLLIVILLVLASGFSVIQRYGVRGIVVFLALAILGLIVIGLARLGTMGWELTRDRLENWRERPLDPLRWVADVTSGSSRQQAWLLSIASYKRFGFAREEEMLELLIRVAPFVLQDPALSVLNAKRSKIMDIRKQDRSL